MAKLGLSSPWVQYYHQLEAFFRKDNDVKIVYNEDENDIKIYVADAAKAEALSQILPQEKSWGTVTLYITVIPANTLSNKVFTIPVSIWEAAFKNNEALDYIKIIKGLYCNDLTYIVFKREVIQYFTDSLSDINGLRSTLYQDIAEDLFVEHENVFFNTNNVQNRTISVDSCTISAGSFPYVTTTKSI